MAESKRGLNSVVLRLTAELLTVIEGKCPSGTYKATWLTKKLLEDFKEDFLKVSTKEEYEKQLKKASRTMIQIKNDNREEKKEQLNEKMKGLELRKRELELRERKETRIEKGLEPEEPEPETSNILGDNEKFRFMGWLKDERGIKISDISDDTQLENLKREWRKHELSEQN